MWAPIVVQARTHVESVVWCLSGVHYMGGDDSFLCANCVSVRLRPLTRPRVRGQCGIGQINRIGTLPVVTHSFSPPAVAHPPYSPFRVSF